MSWSRPRLLLAAGLAALWLLASLERLPLLHSAPFTSEAAHYIIARDLWDGANNLYGLAEEHNENPWLFWQRPMLGLLLAPGAAVSFEAWRLWHMGIAASLPVLGVLVLRKAGTPMPFAAGAGLLLALHPRIVPWGAIVMPDSLMTVLLLGGLLAHQSGRPALMGILLWLATWVKEIAAVAVAGLLVAHLLPGLLHRKQRLWPLSVDRTTTALLAVLAVAFVPLLYSLSRAGWFPGLAFGGDWRFVVETGTLVPWLWPAPALALLVPRLRALAGMALAWQAFWLAYRLVLGKAFELWYVVSPAAFAVLCAAGLLGVAWHRAADAARNDGQAWRRWSVAAGSVLLAAMLAIPMAVPSTEAANQRLATPLTHWGQWTMDQVEAYETTRSKDLAIVLSRMPDQVDVITVVDVDWSFVEHPVAAKAGKVYVVASQPLADSGLPLDRLAMAIERSNYTLVFDSPLVLNEALREAYEPCLVTHDVSYTVYDGRACPGRLDLLGQRLAAARSRHAT